MYIYIYIFDYHTRIPFYHIHISKSFNNKKYPNMWAAKGIYRLMKLLARPLQTIGNVPRLPIARRKLLWLL